MSLSQNKIFVSLYPILFPYISNLPEEMAKKVHTDTLLVFMVQGEVCLVLEKRIKLDAWSLSFFKLKPCLLKLLVICHVLLLLLLLTFENSNQIKLLQIASNCIRLIIWLKQDKIG